MKVLIALCLLVVSVLSGENTLKANLERSRVGDFVVTSQGGNYSLLLINHKDADTLTLEEITIPSRKVSLGQHNWKQWVDANAPCHSSWVLFDIDTRTGKVKKAYSYTKKNWLDVENIDNFLSKLLTLNLQKIPFENMKRIGAPPRPGFPDHRRVWQPKMFFEGEEIKGMEFEAWRTKWPKDGGPISEKTIDVYVLRENEKYPTYFPYWLQVSGSIGKARIHILDSGAGLTSPKTFSISKGS